MNIYTTPQTIPNSAYTLVGKPVTTKVNIPNMLYVDQESFRDNNVKQITFTKTSKVQS